jgi:ribosomal protein L16 Arg81 hydroxylase
VAQAYRRRSRPIAIGVSATGESITTVSLNRQNGDHLRVDPLHRLRQYRLLARFDWLFRSFSGRLPWLVEVSIFTHMLSTQQITVEMPKPLTFEELILPMSVDEFLNEFWQKRPCYVHGPQEKFKRLFSWNDLNHLLETHHFSYPRLRMSKDGTDVPPTQYIESLRFTKATRADSWALNREMAAGASLILLHADEFHPRLQSLADALTSALGWYSEVEVIAGLGSSNALPVHFDSNDCLVLQIQGTKRWHFYAPTRPTPLRASKIFPERYDAMPAPEPNEAQSTVTFEVTAGDLVYIPRGWWHLVEPLPGPCLSLNPTVFTGTMQDLVRWLVNELSVEEIWRLAIPTGVPEQRSALKRLASVINRALTPEAILQFRRFMLNEMEARPSLSLPDSATQGQRLNPSATVLISGGQVAHVTTDNASTVFRVRWRGRDFHFERQHLEVFLRLNDGHSHQVSDLLASYSSNEARIGTMAFLLTLRKEGILAVTP